MKKFFKKRLAAFKVGLVLSIMITPFCFYKMSETVYGLTNVITYNNYGSFSRTNEAFGLSATTASVNLGCSSVVGELNGIYNGVVTINYSIGNGLSIANFSVIPENCHIISYSSSACTIEFYGVSNWTVTFLETQTKNVASLWEDLTIQSLSGWNMTYLERSDSAVMVNIQNRLSDLKTYTDGIEGLLTTNNQLLTTIANNGGSGGSSTVNNIDINVDHIADELSLLKTSNDSILDELLGFFTDGLGQMLTIESVIDAIETTTTALTGIQTQLTSIGTTLNSISTTLNNINTAIQNIDNKIDTITWIDGDNISNGTSLTKDNFGTVQISNADEIYYKLTFPDNDLNKNRLYKIRLALQNSNAAFRSQLKIKFINRGNVNNNEAYNMLDYSNYFINPVNSYYIDLYLWGAFNSYYIICFTGNTVITSYNSNANCYYIEDTDIEYWTMLNYINQYNSQRKILEALQNLSINLNGDIIQQTETVINNYDTNFNTIHNIETNYVNNFDTTNPGVQTLLNSNLTLPDGFVEGSNFIKVLFPKVVDNSSLIGFPYFLILAIVVLIVLLG